MRRTAIRGPPVVHGQAISPLQRHIEFVGGLMAAHEIRAALQVGPMPISEAVRAGEIIRVRQGWYANPWLPVPEQHAARVGGQLACCSAAKALGMWDPRVEDLHLCVPVNAARLRRTTSYRSRLRADDELPEPAAGGRRRGGALDGPRS